MEARLPPRVWMVILRREKLARHKKLMSLPDAIRATQVIASFVGFAPINNPAVTILVTLDSPVGLHEGGQVSAPVFKRVAEQVLSYLNVPQDEPITPGLRRASYHPGQTDSEP